MFKKITYLLRDVKNLTIYGLNGPRALELLYVDPAIITSIQNERFYKTKDAGKVIKGDWGVRKSLLKNIKKYQIIYNKVILNATWEGSGIFKFYEGIPSYTLEENILRHEGLSEFIEHLRLGGRFQTRREINPKNFREDGGVIVHLDQDGDLIFSGNGYHRLAIAQALQLKYIPVALGVVHEWAIKSGVLKILKEKSKKLIAEHG